MIVGGEEVARFVSDKIGAAFCPPYYAFGTQRDGEIVHGVLVNQYEGHDCHISAAGHGWTRGFLRVVGGYVFDHLGCERMTFVTERDDVAALALRLGGQMEGRLRSHFGPGRDGMILGVLKDEWRY